MWCQSVKNILRKYEGLTDDSVANEISDAVFNLNSLLSSTSERSRLSTDYRRNAYFKEHFTVIDPVEYIYDLAHKKTFVYVSVSQS